MTGEKGYGIREISGSIYGSGVCGTESTKGGCDPDTRKRVSAAGKEGGFAVPAGPGPLCASLGKYSITTGRFSGVLSEKEKYHGSYETEWEFLAAALEKNGVPGEAILREDKATYTYENALCSARVLKEKKITVKKAIICCQAFHARRCQLYYQLAFPDTQLILDPVDTGVNRTNWYRTEEGIRLVLGEAQRYGTQFYEIMDKIRKNLPEVDAV